MLRLLIEERVLIMVQKIVQPFEKKVDEVKDLLDEASDNLNGLRNNNQEVNIK